MDMREDKELLVPAASGAGAGGYGHIFGETSGGVLERNHNGSHHHHHHHHHHNQGEHHLDGENGGSGGGRSKGRAAVTGVRYRECLKNHAASVGGNIYDGCGEFMPSGEDGTLEALKCAACECHRNFHRKEIDGESQLSLGPANFRRGVMLPHLQLPPPLPSPASAIHGHHKFSMALNLHSSPTAPIIAPMNVAYAGGGGGGGNESSSEDLNVFHSNAEAMPASCYSLSKKRFRTKFTQDQKDRMLEFAEKVGWRFQKQDEEEVERFCSENGVKRQVLKVWMHNNKNTMKKHNDNHEPGIAGNVAGAAAAVRSES